MGAAVLLVWLLYVATPATAAAISGALHAVT
jgi:hypothetical protein